MVSRPESLGSNPTNLPAIANLSEFRTDFNRLGGASVERVARSPQIE